MLINKILQFFRGDFFRLNFDTGGGGSSQPAQPTSQTVTQTNIPPELMPYATDVLGKGQALTDISKNPYQQYAGNRIAGFNDLQNQALGSIQGMQASPAIGTGMGMTSSAGIGGLNAGNQYNSSTGGIRSGMLGMGDQYGQNAAGNENYMRNAGGAYANGAAGTEASMLQAGNQYNSSTGGLRAGMLGMGNQYGQNAAGNENYMRNAGQQYDLMATNPSAISAYMSPYMQNAVDWQKQQAEQDFARAQPGMGANAVRSGAFGGNRDAISRSEGQRNLQNQLAGIQATGTQNAYTQGLQSMQFGANRGMEGAKNELQSMQYGSNLGMQGLQNAAQIAQYGAGLNMQGLQNETQSRQFGATRGMEGAKNELQSLQYGSNLGMQGLQNAAQNDQYGAGLNMQGLSLANQSARNLGDLGMQNYQQNMGIAQAQQLGGAQIQAQEQQGLSQQYQDFLNQQNYPYKQLGFMNDLIRGTPTSGGASTMYQAPPSAMSQSVGLLGGLGSLAGAYSAAQPKG